MTYTDLSEIRARVTTSWNHHNCKFRKGDRVRVNKERLAAGVGFRTSDVLVSRRRRHSAIFAPDARRCLPCSLPPVPGACRARCRWRSARMVGLGNTPLHGCRVDGFAMARIRQRQLRGCAPGGARSPRRGQRRPRRWKPRKR